MILLCPDLHFVVSLCTIIPNMSSSRMRRFEEIHFCDLKRNKFMYVGLVCNQLVNNSSCGRCRHVNSKWLKMKILGALDGLLHTSCRQLKMLQELLQLRLQLLPFVHPAHLWSLHLKKRTVTANFRNYNNRLEEY